MSSVSSLRALSNIIADSVTQIEQSYAKASATVPSLDDPFNPTNPAEAVGRDPSVDPARMAIVAAAAQLTSTVRDPALALMFGAFSYHISSCLRVVSALNVVEILREAGPQGLNVKDVAKQCNTDSDKLSRVLRLLASNHVFREISPDIFTNNRLSSVLDKGKPSRLLFDKPEEKFIGTSGVSAFLEHVTDEGFKSSAYLAESLTDPKTAFKINPLGTPFARAFESQDPIFAWFERPDNLYRLARFGIGQEGTSKLEPPDAILRGFNWGSLPKDAIVVDVGGGIGSSSLVVAKAYPHLNIINQDRALVVEQAKGYWMTQLPSYIESGKAKMQAHDFFEPQPVKNAAVFLLRQIAHDWPDELVHKIFSQLRASAASDTKLVVVDQVVPYASKSTIADGIPGAARPPAPPPLLPNMGAASTVYLTDLHMYTLLNGKERTVGGFIDVFEKSGWKVAEVYHVPGSLFSHVVGVPI